MTDALRPAACLACQQGADRIPLIPIDYRGARHWICPQHLPVLIHDPQRLVGLLRGAERMKPADHHD